MEALWRANIFTSVLCYFMESWIILLIFVCIHCLSFAILLHCSSLRSIGSRATAFITIPVHAMWCSVQRCSVVLERFSVTTHWKQQHSTLLGKLELAFTALEGSKFKISLYIFFSQWASFKNCVDIFWNMLKEPRLLLGTFPRSLMSGCIGRPEKQCLDFSHCRVGPSCEARNGLRDCLFTESSVWCRRRSKGIQLASQVLFFITIYKFKGEFEATPVKSLLEWQPLNCRWRHHSKLCALWW